MPVPALREIQRLFWHSIADRPAAPSLAPELIAAVEPSATLDRRGRLQVYADAYFWRLREVLREDFPKLAAALGAERFERLAADYLGSYPSENPSVRHLGRALAEFLARRGSGSDGTPAFLSDLARLEWARVEAFDASDAEAIGAEEMRRIPAERWPELRFYPVPALELIEAAWPVHRVWDCEVAADPAPEPTTIMVWRSRDFQVLHRALDPRAALALRLLVAHEPFAAICGAFADLPPGEDARAAGALLAQWLQDGIIARTSFRP